MAELNDVRRRELAIAMNEAAGEKERFAAYNAYVNSITPKHSITKNVFRAYVTGGIICTFGQLISYMGGKLLKLDTIQNPGFVCIVLVLISAVLTGFGLYKKIVKWGGAGALVPITGFANSVSAPAVEYKVEGQVYGIGCKIFTIAGPVILYGVFTSWLAGLIYYIFIH